MEEGLSIRRATTDDADTILDCLRSAFEPYRDRYTPEAYRDTTLTPQTLRRRLETMSVFVAADPAGEITGTIACAPVGGGEGHLRGMAVRPAWHGRGVAGRLLEAAEAELRRLGCTRVTLDTTEPLARAVRFYERHGYRASGRTSDYFGMPLFERVKSLG
jgi:GNAT superfamily N-acetyltransferase